MAASKSAYIQLYDEETKHDDYKFQIKNVQAKLSFKDERDRDMEFNSQGGYKFIYGAAMDQSFDLKSRFDAVEAEVDVLQAAPGVANNAAAIAAEIVDRTAADTALQNQITAEVSARATADQTLQTALDTQEAKQVTDDTAQTASVAAEASSRAAGDSAEQVRALAAEAALQLQITNVLSTAPAALDDLAEILSHISAEDATLAASIASLQAQVTALQDKVDELTNS
jgi:hypothetical protein